MPDKKEYVKLWLSYESYFEPYSDVEVGRLVRAMMKYKSSREDAEFNGNERYVWPAIRRDIDEANEAQEKRAETNRKNGENGGRPKKAAGSEESEENRKNPVGFEETEKTDWVFEKPKKAMDKGQGQGQRSRTKDMDKGENRARVSTRFTPPTVDEVRAYCQERQNGVDPERFVDFYASKGWMVGKNKMADWKSCVRTWERRQEPAAQPPAKKSFSEIAAEMAKRMEGEHDD